MRRPFAVIGAVFFLTLLILNTLPAGTAWVLLAVSVALWLVCLCVRRLRSEPIRFVLCMSVLAACVVFLTQTETVNKPILALDRQTVRITAHMRALPQSSSDGRTRVELRTDTIGDTPMRCKLVLYSAAAQNAQLSDAFCLTAKVYARNDANGEGAYLTAYDDSDLTFVPDRKTLVSRALAVRRYVLRTMAETLPGTPGAVLTAMLIGDAELIPFDVYTSMRRSGIAHIFSVSGFHLSVFALAFLHVMEKRRFPRQIYVPICMALVLFVMAVTGFPLSCIRAGIMLFILLIGKLLVRQADALNSLGFAVLMIGAVQPFCAADAGLQLSVLGTVGMILGAPIAGRIANKIRLPFRPLQRLFRMLCSTAIVSVCIVLLTTPVMILSFGVVSIVAPLTNACMLFAAQWAMILASFSVLFSLHPLLAFLHRLFLFAAALLARYCLAVSSFFGDLPFAAPRVDVTAAALWVAGTLVMLALAILLRVSVKRAIRILSAVSLSILLVSFAYSAWSMYDVAQVTLPDAGGSAAVLVRSRGKTALIGCGTGAEYAVSDVTDRLSLLLLPDKRDAVSGAAHTVLRRVPTDLLVLPAQNYRNHSLYFHHTTHTLHDAVYTVGSAEIEIRGRDADASSALLRVGDTSMLMLFSPGCDLSALPRDWLDADLLYVCGDVPPGLQAEKFGFVFVQASQFRTDAIVRRIVLQGGHAGGPGTLVMHSGGLIRWKEGS